MSEDVFELGCSIVLWCIISHSRLADWRLSKHEGALLTVGCEQPLLFTSCIVLLAVVCTVVMWGVIIYDECMAPSEAMALVLASYIKAEKCGLCNRFEQLFCKHCEGGMSAVLLPCTGFASHTLK